jgi:hypothetical protein
MGGDETVDVYIFDGNPITGIPDGLFTDKTINHASGTITRKYHQRFEWNTTYFNGIARFSSDFRILKRFTTTIEGEESKTSKWIDVFSATFDVAKAFIPALDKVEVGISAFNARDDERNIVDQVGGVFKLGNKLYIALDNREPMPPGVAYAGNVTLTSNLARDIEATKKNRILEAIGDGCFKEEVFLTSILIPSTIRSIDDSAFEKCTTMSSFDFTQNSQLRHIGNNAFSECSSLAHIIIPGYVDSIGDNAFFGVYDARATNNIFFLGRVPNKMGRNVFSYRSNRTSDYDEIFGPLNLRVIKDNIYPNDLTGFTSHPFVTVYCQSDPAGHLKLNFRRRIFYNLPTPGHNNQYGSEATIYGDPSGNEALVGGLVLSPMIGKYYYIVAIANNAFENYINLTGINIPNTVRSIGNYAFKNCSSINLSVTFDTISQVKSIGDFAFSDCSFASITLPESVIYIGSNAFSNCKNLTSFKIPSLVTVISDNAFADCSNLSSLPGIGSSDLSTIGSYAFKGLKITSIVIPASVTTIGEGAFKDCASLTNVTFADGSLLTTLSPNVFEGCTNLTTVTFIKGPLYKGSQIKAIGASAFKGCTKLTSPVIPQSVTSIGVSAFEGCTSINQIEIPDSVQNIGNNAFQNCSAVTFLTFGSKQRVNSFGDEAFKGCSNLVSVFFFGTVPSFPTNAFIGISSNAALYYLSNPANITFPSYFIIAKQIFEYSENSGSNNITITKFNPSTYNMPFVIPETIDGYNVVSIYGYNESISTDYFGAFEGASLSSITIPASVTLIRFDSFIHCQNLNEVIFMGNIPEIESKAFLDIKQSANAYYISNTNNINTSTFSSLNFKSLYTIQNNGTITSFNLTTYEGLLDIPNKLDAVVVRSIGPNAFRNCTAITSVIVPNSTISIAPNAFDGCSNLLTANVPSALINNLLIANVPSALISTGKVNVGNGKPFYGTIGVTIVEYILFQGTLSLSGVSTTINLSKASLAIIKGYSRIADNTFKNITTLTSVTISDSVTSIGNSAFEGCTGLSDITFAAGSKLTTIGNNAFKGTNLSSIYIPNIVTTIGTDAFLNCTNLTSIVIPNSVTDIDSNAFDNCIGLLSVTFESESKLKNIPSNMFRGCVSLLNITIPASVITIGSNAFQNCSSLTSITFDINSNLTSIGANAFESCTKLASITIPNSVTSIGANAFRQSTDLSTIIFNTNSKLTSINIGTFSDCINLVTINIPSLVTSIGYQAFYNCNKLVLSIASNNTSFSYDDRIIYNKTKTTLVQYLIYDTVTYTIPDFITKIGTGAFYGLTSLTTVVIPGSVTSIENDAFNNCTNLKTVVFTNNVPTLATNAFSNIDASAAVYYLDNTNNIDLASYFGSRVFSLLENKKFSINRVGGSTVTRNTITGFNPIALSAGYDKTLFNGPIPISLGGFPITHIGNNAFQGCTGLTSLMIPNPIVNIGVGAFQECSNITSITISNSVQYIYKNAFLGCTKLVSVIFQGDIPVLEDEAFGPVIINAFVEFITNTKNVNLASVFGKSISYLETSSSTVKITGLLPKTYAGELPLPSTLGGKQVTSIDSYAFKDCTGITSVTIPNTVTSIGEYAFNACTKLTYINIPDFVTSIGSNAFRDCTSLASIEIPALVTSPLTNVFVGCSSLLRINVSQDNTVSSSDNQGVLYNKSKSHLVKYPEGNQSTQFVIPASVTSILSSAFSYTQNLLYVTFAQDSTIQQINAFAFQYGTSLISIKIPNSVTSIGVGAFRNSPKLELVTIPAFVTSISDQAFSNCPNLATIVTLGNSFPTSASGSFTNISPSLVIYNPNFTDLSANLLSFLPSGVAILKYKIDPYNNVQILSANSPLSNSSNARDINIVSSLEGCPVTSIGDYAFKSKSWIKSITFPASTVSFGTQAFDSCIGLTSVTVPVNVTIIGRLAFADCTKLETVTFASGSLRTTIGDTVFYRCTGLTSVIFGSESHLTDFGETAFEGCISLASITIPNTITTINRRAFKDCRSITSISIPESVTTIGDNAFANISATAVVSFLGNIPNINATVFANLLSPISSALYARTLYYRTNTNNVFFGSLMFTTEFSYSVDAFNNATITSIKYDVLGRLDIPSTIAGYPVTSIITDITRPNFYTSSSNVFLSNTSSNALQIIIPNSVTYIGDYVFNNCSKLNSISIPNSVTTIGENAFSNCRAMSSITFAADSRLLTIGKEAFYSCTNINLTSIEIPASVTSIGSYAFRLCERLRSITFLGNVPSLPGNNGTSVFENLLSPAKVYFANNTNNVSFIGQQFASPTYPIPEQPDVSYNVVGSQVTITKIASTGYNGPFVIPSTKNGYTVTAIGDNAFEDMNITSVIIPDTVTTIGIYAFRNTQLRKVFIPRSVTSIGGGAFIDISLSVVEFNGIIPSLGVDVFKGTSPNIVFYASNVNNVSLLNVDISYATIPNVSFKYEKNVDNINIVGITPQYYLGEFTVPNIIESLPVTSIDDTAFVDCFDITSIIIPSSITSINEKTFSGCTSLNKITVSESNSIYCDISGVLYNKAKTILIKYPIGNTQSNYTIPNSVTTIGANAFEGCTRLTSITISTIDSLLNTIGTNAFQGCTNLKNITPPNELTTISDSAFDGCSSLDMMYFSSLSKLTTIGSNVFKACSSLVWITFPATITYIGSNAFKSCNNLSYISFSGTIPVYVGDNAFSDISDESILYYVNSSSNNISSYFKRIITYSLNGSQATITKFEPTNYTGSVDIPSSIGGNNVISINADAFDNCTGITEITIPSAITSIGNYSFKSCSSLRSISVSPTNNNYSSDIYGVLYDKNKTRLILSPRSNTITAYSIPSTVISVDSYAFRGNRLSLLEIPASITTINSDAFELCDSLESVLFVGDDPIKPLGGSAFNGISQTSTAYYQNDPDSNISAWTQFKSKFGYTVDLSDNVLIRQFRPQEYSGSVYIPDTIGGKNVTSIIGITETDGSVRGVFQGCKNITNIILSNFITYLDNYAFQNCEALRSINIPDSVTYIGNNTLDGCSTITTILFGSNSQLITIGDEAFNALQINSMTVPANVTSIGKGAFKNCSQLTSVTFAENSELKTIGNQAFLDCGNLTTFEIPNSVTLIEDNAFENCSLLTSVVFRGNIPVKFNTDVFEDISTDAIAYYIGDPNTNLSSWPNFKRQITYLVDASNNVTIRAFDSKTYDGTFTIPDTIWNKPVTTIHEDAFEYCHNLSSITVPNTVTTIGANAFRDCSNLTEIIVSPTNDNYSDINGVLFNKSKTTLISFPRGNGVTTYTIPENVTTIGDSVFNKNSSLTSINIPASITTIGSFALNECTNLTMVTFLGIVPDISGNYSFAYDTEGKSAVYYVGDPNNNTSDYFSKRIQYSVDVLNNTAELIRFVSTLYADSFDIPSTISNYTFTSIAADAFKSTRVTSINIPSSITVIGDDAFLDCDRLTDITVSQENKDFSSVNGVLFNKDKTTLIRYPSGNNERVSYIIPETVTTLVDNAFSRSLITSLDIPNSVTAIGENVFLDCSSSLATVTFLGTVHDFGTNTFDGISNDATAFYVTDPNNNVSKWTNFTKNFTYKIESSTVTITKFEPNSYSKQVGVPDTVAGFRVTTIDNVFSGCRQITRIDFPAYVTSITSDAFVDCNNLAYIGISPNNVKYSSDASGVLFNDDYTTLVQYPANCDIFEYTVPTSVTTIDDYAFQSCVELKSILISELVTSIGDGAFADCTGLSAVNFDANSKLTKLGKNVFYNCIRLRSIIIPANLPSIGNNTFIGSSLLKLYVYRNNKIATRPNLEKLIGGIKIGIAYTPSAVTSTLKDNEEFALQIVENLNGAYVDNIDSLELYNESLRIPYTYRTTIIIPDISLSYVEFEQRNNIVNLMKKIYSTELAINDDSISCGLSEGYNFEIKSSDPVFYPNNTTIITDQGIISIEYFDNKIYTIGGEKIDALTRVVGYQVDFAPYDQVLYPPETNITTNLGPISIEAIDKDIHTIGVRKIESKASELGYQIDLTPAVPLIYPPRINITTDQETILIEDLSKNIHTINDEKIGEINNVAGYQIDFAPADPVFYPFGANVAIDPYSTPNINNIVIENLDKSLHTIGGKKIETIFKTTRYQINFESSSIPLLCLPGTNISTNLGLVPIEDLSKNLHTIDSKNISTITSASGYQVDFVPSDTVFYLLESSIVTNLGDISIEAIDKDIHTIGGNKIKAKTSTLGYKIIFATPSLFYLLETNVNTNLGGILIEELNKNLHTIGGKQITSIAETLGYKIIFTPYPFYCLPRTVIDTNLGPTLIEDLDKNIHNVGGKTINNITSMLGYQIDFAYYDPLYYPPGTTLITNAGEIVIENFDKTIHTIDGKNIDAITRTTVVDLAVYPNGIIAPTAPICFPAGTNITTDQGDIAIEELKTAFHTIRGKKIVAVTKTITLQKHIISIEKDAITHNVPSVTTQISKEHRLFYRGKMIRARELVGLCQGVTEIPYNGKILYNVLLKEHDKMMVNNLICETLNPENIVAKLYTGKFLTDEERIQISKKLNKIIKTNNIPEYKKLYASLK